MTRAPGNPLERSNRFGEDSMKLTKDQYERECNYRLAAAIMKTLLGRGILTKDEYRRADKRLVEKYNPVWGQLPGLAIV